MRISCAGAFFFFEREEGGPGGAGRCGKVLLARIGFLRMERGMRGSFRSISVPAHYCAFDWRSRAAAFGLGIYFSASALCV